MKKSLGALALILALTANAGIAAAQGAAPIDLKGSWVATSEAVVTGSAMHRTPARNDEPRVDNVEFTYAITGQDGQRFWGTLSSKHHKESVIGVIGFDGKTVVARDTDGLYQGTIIDNDTIDLIYSHTGKSRVVAAHRFKRQK